MEDIMKTIVQHKTISWERKKNRTQIIISVSYNIIV